MKEHNTKQLFSHLFLIMEELKENKVGVEEAKAQAGLVKQANNLLKYELDRAKAIQKFDKIIIREIES